MDRNRKCQKDFTEITSIALFIRNKIKFFEIIFFSVYFVSFLISTEISFLAQLTMK